MIQIGHVIENKKIDGTMTGVTDVTKAQKVWGSLQALGDIAFAYSYSMILIEIQVLIHFLVFLFYIFIRLVLFHNFIKIFPTVIKFKSHIEDRQGLKKEI